MRRVSGFFKHLKIHKKIMLLYGICIAPVLLTLCIMDIWIMSRAIINNIRMSVENNMDVVINQIAVKTNSMKNCANITVMYFNELDFLRSESKENLSDLARHNQVLKKMNYASSVFKDVDAMLFVDQKNNIYGITPQIEEIWQEKDRNELLQIMQQHGGEAVWFPMNAGNSITESEGELTLTMGKNIVDISTGERLGVLFVALKESSLEELYSSLKLSEHSYYVLVSEDGVVVSSPDKEEVGESYTIKDMWSGNRKIEGYLEDRQYLYAHRLKTVPYYLLFHAPIMELTQDIRILVFWILIIGFLCAILAIIIAVILARRITRPIICLADTMDEVSGGDLTVRCENDTQDETRLIAEGFNHMLDTIEELVENVGEEQREKQKYELALIQSQIKPHFLYNTLDTIYVLAHLNRNEDAKQTAKALADFYRVALSSGKEIITIGEEIKCLEDYLKIQKIRYGEDFDYKFEIPEEMLQVNILKMTLQPLAENAIYHGLREKQDGGMLTIRGVVHSDFVEIAVEDNGVGMEEDILANILQEDSTAKSFGLRNVDRRIRLYYGDKYGLCIKSSKGMGTTVYIHIPARERENGGMGHV